MLVLISDSSVLIDIENGDLTSAMFSLPWQFSVPDTLFSEELTERHSHLLHVGLICKTLNEVLVAEAYNLRQQHAKPSVNDLLALVLAKHENCPLLTGDRDLKKVANQLSIEVHGTIWLVEQIIQHDIITAKRARLSFQRMRDSLSRLPWIEVENMLERVSKRVLQEA